VTTTHRVTSTDDVTLALHDLGGGGPDLLLCHPTGFHGLAWAPVAAALAGVAHCWALDFRGHGDSTRPASGSYDWHGPAADVLAVIDHLGAASAGPMRAVGHSMGGAALVLAELARPGTMAGLWLYEPIIFPAVEGGGVPGSNPMAVQARRRKAIFPSREAARANYAAKPPLGRFRPDALDAYVEHGFRDVAGGVELKCAPEVEAAVFERGGEHGAFARLGEVTCPVTVVGSGDGAPPSWAAPLVAAALPHGRAVTMEQLTHFGPMEDPDAVAAAIAADLLL
jgi:pimeloyl-ACP methyl ester carboxylesterase